MGGLKAGPCHSCYDKGVIEVDKQLLSEAKSILAANGLVGGIMEKSYGWVAYWGTCEFDECEHKASSPEDALNIIKKRLDH